MPSASDDQPDFEDSALSMERGRSLRTLVREAAARLRKSSSGGAGSSVARSFGKGNGERFQDSQY